MTKPLRAGVIGLSIGKLHAEAYAANKDAELVALCDIWEERLEKRGEQFPGTELYTDYHEMLAKANLDVVDVCVPNDIHAEVAIAALEAGVNVCCEKPLSATLEGAQAITAAVEEAPGKFTVCYDKRYRAEMQWVKQAVDSGLLGEIYHIQASWLRETGIPGGWFTQKHIAGGGPLIDLGVHVLDLSLHMLDFPQVLTVSGTTRAVFGPDGGKTWGWGTGGDPEVGYTVEDGAVGLIRLAGGKSLALEVTWGGHRRPHQDDIYLRIAGDKAAIDVSIKNYTEKDTVRVYTELNGEPVEIKPDLEGVKTTSHAALIDAFVASIHADATPPAPVAQGLATVEVLDAFYRSAAEGREIALA